MYYKFFYITRCEVQNLKHGKFAFKRSKTLNFKKRVTTRSSEKWSYKNNRCKYEDAIAAELKWSKSRNLAAHNGLHVLFFFINLKDSTCVYPFFD